ncbi:related to protein DGCR14, probably involved in pre-mRNA splicing [Melanopsichium pennsylvanicum]|uniref:Related to protein DGCR14, probably involved in pre-mRNA splicing n=2 Tax=Melanopsichium pennsylvanicum TaxID=63383 RepID=A0AAJ4XL08_9BASI|nr:related to protein DGCR14, probably involved in pre-mRNA splicing [Melanopsichium pennsylvanicum 4]SNX84100.1 related to protein DGCR14, probably involved in pre-mRNA splicing [Melanopsichium pennsylvanicum]
MPLRKEPPTPRSAVSTARQDAGPSMPTSLGPLIPFKPGQTSFRRQAILTEDEYTSALSSIIKRDFFPNIDRLRAENEYLTAIEREDPVQIRVALNGLLRLDDSAARPAKKHTHTDISRFTPKRKDESGEWDDKSQVQGTSPSIFNPNFTPADSTPGTIAHDDLEAEQDEPGSGISPNTNLSLASFQSQYTSEDNASFSQILDRGNQERKRKYAHLFAKEQVSEQRIKQIAQAEHADADKGKKLMIEANPDNYKVIEEVKETLSIGDGTHDTSGKGKETPQVLAEKKTDPMDDLILVPEPRKDDRPPLLGLSRWKYTARNALIYGPDANHPYLHGQPELSSSKAEIGDEQLKPQINFCAVQSLTASTSNSVSDTREGSELAWSPSSSRIDAAISRGRAGCIASSSDYYAEDPKVNGWGFVTPYSTPQHSVSQHVSVENMHLKIYNVIKSRRAASAFNSYFGSSRGEELGGRDFELPKMSKREELAQKLASPKTNQGGSTPYGVAKYVGLTALKRRQFVSPRRRKKKVGDLTPAGRALLERSSDCLTLSSAGVGSPTARGGVGWSGRVGRGVGDRGWTPTPQHKLRR